MCPSRNIPVDNGGSPMLFARTHARARARINNQWENENFRYPGGWGPVLAYLRGLVKGRLNHAHFVGNY